MLDSAARKKRVRAVLRILHREFPDAKCSLDHKNPFQLLVATILSAQCTDERVNKVTPALFAAAPDPEDQVLAAILRWLAEEVSADTYVNVMQQYHPCATAREDAIIARPISPAEYDQALDAARSAGLTRLDRRRRRFFL